MPEIPKTQENGRGNGRGTVEGGRGNGRGNQFQEKIRKSRKHKGFKKKRRGYPKSEKSKKMNSLSTTYPVAHFLRWFHFFGEIYQQRHNATTPRRHATTPQRHSATAPQCHSALRHNATTPRRHATTPRRTTPGARARERRDAQRHNAATHNVRRRDATTPRHNATRRTTHEEVRGGGHSRPPS